MANLTNIKIFILLFFGTSLCQGQSTRLRTFITDSLDSYIEQGIKDWNIPGLAIGIVKDGKVIFSKGYGTRFEGKDEPVTENTLFLIASTTKAITAATTVLITEDSNLSTTDPVSKWLPGFKLKDSLSSSLITIRDLLSHRSGIPAHIGDFAFWKSNFTQSDIISKMRYFSLNNDIRTRFEYTNVGYTITGEVLKAVTGKEWAQNVSERVFNPIGMSRSIALSSQLQYQENVAFPHTISSEEISIIPFENIDNFGPSGGISSSVNDMCKWLMTFIDNGKLYDEQIYPENVFRFLKRPQTFRGYNPAKDPNSRFLMYGLGWHISDQFGKLKYYHGGATGGYVSNVFLIPEERFGFVILTNSRPHYFHDALEIELFYALLNKPFENASQILLDSFKKEQSEKNTNLEMHKNISKENIKVDLTNYTGIYHNEVYGDILVTKNRESLNIEFLKHQDLIAKLNHFKGDVFWTDFSDKSFDSIEIKFFRNDDKVFELIIPGKAWGDIDYRFTKR